MANPSWLKDNAFVVAAIVLPLLVVAIFLLASVAPGWFVDPPRYSLLVALQVRDQDRFGVQYRNEHGRLGAEVSYLGPDRRPNHQVLYRYDPAEQRVTEISAPVGEALREQLQAAYEDKWVALPMPLPAGLAQLNLADGPTAPDGYAVLQPDSGRGGLLEGLFGMRGRDGNLRLHKEGHIVEVPLPDRYGYRRAQLIGWIEP